MKYYINFSDFEEYLNMFNTKIDEFNDEIFNVFKLLQAVEWVGLGHDKTAEAVFSNIDELQKVSESLIKFVEAMNMINDDYSEGVEEIRNKFKDMQDVIEQGKLKRGEVNNES